MDGIERLIKLEKEPTLFELDDGEEEEGSRSEDQGSRNEE